MDIPFLIIDGVIAAQTPKITDAFGKILQDFNVIIEVGYHRGGLSKWLFDNKRSSTTLYSYDITDQAREIVNEDINFIVGDCFEPQVIRKIENNIAEGRCLFLCDGGNKEREFELYAGFIKSGDVIMCHDYSHSDESYARIQQLLRWPTAAESHRKNIQGAVNDNALKEYNYAEFRDVLWGAFIK